MNNTVSRPGLEDILLELDALSDRAGDDAIKQKRQQVWRELRPFFKVSDPVELLARELQLQPLTIKRWMSGEFNPRQAHLLRIRSLLGISDRDARSPSVVLGHSLDPPVSFDNAHAAIRTLSHVLFCLKFSKLAFIFKGSLAYHAGRPGAVRESVVSILENKCNLRSPLVMYYFFCRPSRAEDTIARFAMSPRLRESGLFGKLLRPLALKVDEKGGDRLGLAYSPASPFVLIYDDDGQKKFDRFLDVFFEMPVEFVQPDNAPTGEATRKTVFIQQPEPEALRFWQQIAKVLSELKADNSASEPTNSGYEVGYNQLEEEHLNSVPLMNLASLHSA